MADVASWIAAAATMIAAMMTAANLGTRITGWGFVVFTAGSFAWASVGVMTGQTSLAITNGFLLLVNLFGVWRWLGRQARHEQGGTAAVERSRQHSRVPSLFSGGQLIGAPVAASDGQSLGSVVDAMLDCDDHGLSYLVLSEGGIGGAGETLRAVASEQFNFDGEAVTCLLTADQLARIPPIASEAWPVTAPYIDCSKSASEHLPARRLQT